MSRADADAVSAPSPASDVQIERLRSEIGDLDRELVRIIARRMEVARRIGAAKRRLGRPTLDPRREAAVVRGMVEAARAQGLDGEAVRELFWKLIGLCRHTQLDDASTDPSNSGAGGVPRQP